MRYPALLILVLLFLLASPLCAQREDNYLPDNPNVKLEQTNLPIVMIDVDGQMIPRDNRITARMTIIDNGPSAINYADTAAHPGQHIDYQGYIGICYRGNSTFTSSLKKPYSVHTVGQPLEDGLLNWNVSLLGMPKEHRWALIAPYADKSYMRDLLCFHYARPWMDYVPQGRFCELLLDGTYYGIYVLTEQVSKGKGRLNLQEPGDEGDALTGDYLVEIDRNDEVTYRSKFPPRLNDGRQLLGFPIYYQFKEPAAEEMTDAQRKYIQQAIHQMETAFDAYRPGDLDPDYRHYVDVLSFIDYQIAKELGHDVDGYRLSAKMYKRNDSSDGRFKMVLWDMNFAYGNASYYEGWRTDTWVYECNDILYASRDGSMVPFWWRKLNREDSDYQQLLRERWAEYRTSNLHMETAMAAIDSMASVLTSGGAVSRNVTAWPRRGIWPNYYVSGNFDEEIAYLKNWLRQRIQWMDEQLAYGGTDGIRRPSDDYRRMRHITGYYTLDGKAVGVPQRGGIYLLRYSDGSVEKVLY